MNTTQRRVIIEHTHGVWLSMDETGQIAEHESALNAYRAVRKTDTAQVRKDGGLVVTEIEWRNVPDGFVTPGREG